MNNIKLREITDINELKDIIALHINVLIDITNQDEAYYKKLQKEMTNIYNNYMSQVKAGKQIYEFNDVGTVVQPSGDYVLNHEMDYKTYISNFKFWLNKFKEMYDKAQDDIEACKKIIIDNSKYFVYMLIYVNDGKIYTIEE